MFDPSVIFQRTHEGRAEIKQKSHGLTQSERLVLIMVDGVSTYQQVRDKLPSLTDDRFNRALRKLQQKELILEVFMPTEEAEAEHLEEDVIERFLHQDALDPVTIIMFDPEDELAGISAPAASPYQKPQETPAMAPPPAPQLAPQPPLQAELQPSPQSLAQEMPTAVASASIPSITLPTAPESAPVSVAGEQPVSEPASAPAPMPSARPELVVALDDVHKEMVDLLAEEVRQRNLDRPARVVGRPEMPPPQFNISSSRPVERKAPLMQLHWGYWMMGVGTAFIVGYFLI
ncbi:MAG TPA: hypothetical protein VFF81_10655 [Noviherbaspirillum sp.]|nr:hypothetical protein [Noviherbaspirillum sp.]